MTSPQWLYFWMFPIIHFVGWQFLRINAFSGPVSDGNYVGFDHCGLLVSEVHRAIPFYTEVLGFVDETERCRPKTLPYPGAFLRCGKQQIHLMQLPNPDQSSSRPEYPGRDRHIAIAVLNLEVLQKRLSEHQIPFHLSSSGRRAIFCRDYDSNGLEFVEII